MISFLSLLVVCASTLVMCILEPDHSFMQLLFECTSAFGTVGLSTGITPGLSVAGKLVIILTMFIGRLGTLTIITMWSFKQPASAVFTEENITIG